MLLAIVLLLSTLAHAQSMELMRLCPGLSFLTTFAHDYGESIQHVTLEGVNYSPAEATRTVLCHYGWREGADKLELGKAWVEGFVFFGSEVRGEPLVELLPNGDFRYTGWAVSMRGREPGASSTRYQVDITPQAEMTVTTLEHQDRHRPPGHP